MPERKGPFKLVTVNTAPERARRLIGRLIEALKDDYDIEHVDNCDSKSHHFRSWPVKLVGLTSGFQAWSRLCPRSRSTGRMSW